MSAQEFTVERPKALSPIASDPDSTPSPSAAGKVTPRPRTVARGRCEEILHGAAEMFADHGYHGSSLRGISKHIGISHSGMLHHFDCKAALLDGVIDRLEAHAQTALDRGPELCADRGALLRGLAELWHPASLPTRLLATLDAESVSEDHPGRFRLARLRKVHEHILEDCFTSFAAQGLLRDRADAAFAGRALLAQVLNLAVRERTVQSMQHRFHDDAPLKDLIQQVDIFFREEPPAAPTREGRRAPAPACSSEPGDRSGQ